MEGGTIGDISLACCPVVTGDDKDPYIESEEEDNSFSILPFPSDGFFCIAEGNFKKTQDDKYIFLSTGVNGSSGNSIGLISEMCDFLDKVVSSRKKALDWVRSNLYDDKGNLVHEKSEVYDCEMTRFIKDNVVSKKLCKLIPNKVRMFFLLNTVLSEHCLFGLEHYSDPKEESIKREKEKEIYGEVLEMEPFEILARMKNVCKKIIDDNKKIEKMKKEGFLSDWYARKEKIIISKKDYLLFHFVASRFGNLGLNDNGRYRI